MQTQKILPILFLIFVNTLGFSILIPVTPFIVEKYGGNAMTYGIILAAYPIFQFFATPVLGTLSDRYGRRPILLISQLGTLLSWIVFASAYFFPNTRYLLPLPILIIIGSKIVDGITGGNNAVANAFVSDSTTKKERTKVFGWIGATQGLALLMGPAIGGYTASTSVEYLGTALFAVLLSLITLVLLAIFLPESLPKTLREHSKKLKFFESVNILRQIKKFNKNLNLKTLLNYRIFFTLTLNAYTSIVVLYLTNRFDLSPSQVGLIALVVGVFLIFAQAILAKIISDQIGDLRTMILGSTAFIIGLLIFLTQATIPLLVISTILTTLGISIATPTFKALITSKVESKQQGVINGIDEAILAAAAAVGPLFASAIYQQFDSAVFSVSGVILLIALAVFVYKRATNTKANLF